MSAVIIDDGTLDTVVEYDGMRKRYSTTYRSLFDSEEEFLDAAFQHIGITDWDKYVGQDPRFMRPAEVDVLCGDSTKAYKELGWKPKTSFDDLVGKMVKNDIERLS